MIFTKHSDCGAIFSEVNTMRNENYRKRIIDNILDIYLKTFGAVLIEGPKWCGKTWTSKYHSNSEFLLSDPKGNSLLFIAMV